VSNSHDSEEDIVKIDYCANKNFCGPEWDLSIDALIYEHYKCPGQECVHYKPLN
jgi:hypothetical protein